MLMRLPFGRSVSPVTGTNWERTGVEPDIAVAAPDAPRAKAALPPPCAGSAIPCWGTISLHMAVTRKDWEKISSLFGLTLPMRHRYDGQRAVG